MKGGLDIIQDNIILLSLFGGVMLLLYGVRLAGDGLRGWAGPRIKTTLETMTKNRVAALFSGVIITFLLQSSSATAVILVSLIDSGLLSFGQSLGVILGADIGTTLTVQLISFKVHDLALFVCGIGLVFYFIGSDAPRRSAGQGILGFGLIFLSIKLMSDSLAPLKGNELLREILLASGENPILGVLFATLLTAAIQSSAATIGIAITFALNDMITLNAALPIILGANIGTCATGVLASARSGVEAKRSAWANVAFKVIGTLPALLLLGPFEKLILLTAEDAARQIANAHTVFNVGIALLFLPFTPVLGKAIERWIPEREDEQPEAVKPKYLNEAMLQTPALALAQAARETMRLAEFVQDMFKMSLPAVLNNDLRLAEKIENMDDTVDLFDRSIRMYLTKIGKESLGPEEASLQADIFGVIGNLEAIGDILDKNLMEAARKKIEKQLDFSDEGKKEISGLHARVLENFETAMAAFTTRDREIAETVHRNKQRVRDLEALYHTRHLERLQCGVPLAIETSSIHLDVLTSIKRVNTHVTNLVHGLREHNQPS